jgi:hypothetical protein
MKAPLCFIPYPHLHLCLRQRRDIASCVRVSLISGPAARSASCRLLPHSRSGHWLPLVPMTISIQVSTPLATWKSTEPHSLCAPYSIVSDPLTSPHHLPASLGPPYLPCAFQTAWELRLPRERMPQEPSAKPATLHGAAAALVQDIAADSLPPPPSDHGNCRGRRIGGGGGLARLTPAAITALPPVPEDGPIAGRWGLPDSEESGPWSADGGLEIGPGRRAVVGGEGSGGPLGASGPCSRGGGIVGWPAMAGGAAEGSDDWVLGWLLV